MRKLVVITAAVSVFALAACGGDEEPATDRMDKAAPETITQIVQGNEEFSTLLQAVGSAGLAETLSGDGPFTVFAPTDDAFAALPEGTLQSLLEPDQQDQLAGILTYHVVPAEVPASEVTSGDVQTVNGANLTVSVQDGTVTLEDGQGNEALVTQTDIEASNGVIHVIDAVLLPPSA
ncbi:MAG TPA: fasciclin domain-containing protein [Actinomycetota bacterium]|nr:fasciclin domain-containing protein [Actinomycetota bacterium]